MLTPLYTDVSKNTACLHNSSHETMVVLEVNTNKGSTDTLKLACRNSLSVIMSMLSNWACSELVS